MTGMELQVQKEALRSMLAQLEAIVVCCDNCERFAGGVCRLCNQRPPAEVLASGCSEWRFDGIPF